MKKADNVTQSQNGEQLRSYAMETNERQKNFFLIINLMRDYDIGRKYPVF